MPEAAFHIRRAYRQMHEIVAAGTQKTRDIVTALVLRKPDDANGIVTEARLEHIHKGIVVLLGKVIAHDDQFGVLRRIEHIERLARRCANTDQEAAISKRRHHPGITVAFGIDEKKLGATA